jgi:UDP-2-acetamido-2-deoxy-ribo-hexuluronate aminotransferase
MIPYYDLNLIQSDYLLEMQSVASSVISSGNYISETNAFETEFANYVRSPYCVGTNSGTSSLILALKALDIGPGDEVITVSHTYKATVAAIVHVGATPVFVDIDDTYTMDPSKIRAAITPKTKCILPVHMYGNVAEMREIRNIALYNNLYIVEDCAQAVGSKYGGNHVGTFGDVGCFSFYPGKGLGACGNAGAVVCKDENLYNKMLRLRSHGEGVIGFNFRMDVLQAEILRIKLKYFPEQLKLKQTIAKFYNWHNMGEFRVLPFAQHSYHIYPILRENREEFINEFKDTVEMRMHYPLPVHRQKGYEQKVNLPMTDYVSSRQISIPIYPKLDYKLVVERIKFRNFKDIKIS